MFPRIKKIIFEKNIVSLATSVTGASLGLISFIILTRTFEKEIFGDWVLYTTLASFTDLLRFGLTKTAVVRFLSGETEENKQIFLGSSFSIGFFLAGILAAAIWLIFLSTTFLEVEINGGYRLYLIWYPVLAFCNLSWNNAFSLFQAEQRFSAMLYVKLVNLGIFMIFLILNHFWLHLGIKVVVLAHLGANLLASILVSLKKWDGLVYIRKSTVKARKTLLDFGKFSMGTLVGSSLLKSADTFIIGLSPFLGSAGIAQYAIPLKLTDLLGIPLRSFTMTAYPKMSKKSIQGNIEGLKKTFYAYSGAITFLFFPVAVLGFIFAEPLVWALGGNEYKESLPVLTNLFRIFSFYTLLLPIDRFTGVALDSLNKPKFNFYKVLIMASANIVGDVIAVFWFKSLEAVAVVTVLFTIIGIIAGFAYLSRIIHIQYKYVFFEGIGFFKNLKSYI